MILGHGLGGRSDLPLPVWLFVYGASFALVISFVALRILWPRPRLARAAKGASLPSSVQRAGPTVSFGARVLGLGLFVGVFLAAAWGIDDPQYNIAPVAVFVIFWVGFQVASALVGDLWRAVNPFDSIAALFRLPMGDEEARSGQWTAAAMLGSFVWLELAYHDPASPRVIAVWMIVYTGLALTGASTWGRRWLTYGEGFGALFGLLAHLGPLYRDDETRRVRLRWPLAGLSAVPVRPGTAAVVMVALGSTTFDGVSRTTWWVDTVGTRAGWSLTVVATVGLVGAVAVVALAYTSGVWVTARLVDRDPVEMADAFLPSLIPIVLAYSVAHYFSLFAFESQTFVALASDPLARRFQQAARLGGRRSAKTPFW